MTDLEVWPPQMGKALPIVIALLYGVGQAFADDTFSRAVYCSAVLKGQIEASRQKATARGVDRDLKPTQRQQAARTVQQPDQQYTSEFNRLREFVNGNIHPGDMDQYVAFMAAQRRGEREFAQCQQEKEQAETCLGSCGPKCSTGDLPCLQGCDRQCGAPTCVRTDGCSDTSFLPN